MKLDVYIHGRLVGVLEQTDINRYVFTYAHDANPEDAVSLIMPVRAESWVHHGGLHPVFQVSLPEGVLRSVLTRKYAKFFPQFGDMELLSTIGAHLIGRLRIVPHGNPLVSDSPSDGLEDLLSVDSKALVDQFLEIRAVYSGVSGAFPKVLAKSPTGLSAPTDRSTMVFDKWIVKTNSTSTPDLVLNEYFGMILAQNVGLTVPEYLLSDDAQRLLIKRFDVDEQGNSLGFEDMCALIGQASVDKFSGSVERIVKTINEMCPPREAARAREAFYLQYATCMAMRNGDAHMKNFGLLYDHPDNARLSPAYDMVTMSAYAPRCEESGDAVDMPALTFGGVRRWPTQKTLKALAARCLVSASRQKALSAQMAEGFLQTARQIDHHVRQERLECAPIGKRLLELWACGIALHDDQVAQEIAALAAGIECDEHAPEIYVKPEKVRY